MEDQIIADMLRVDTDSFDEKQMGDHYDEFDRRVQEAMDNGDIPVDTPCDSDEMLLGAYYPTTSEWFRDDDPPTVKQEYEIKHDPEEIPFTPQPLPPSLKRVKQEPSSSAKKRKIVSAGIHGIDEKKRDILEAMEMAELANRWVTCFTKPYMTIPDNEEIQKFQYKDMPPEMVVAKRKEVAKRIEQKRRITHKYLKMKLLSILSMPANAKYLRNVATEQMLLMMAINNLVLLRREALRYRELQKYFADKICPPISTLFGENNYIHTSFNVEDRVVISPEADQMFQDLHTNRFK